MNLADHDRIEVLSSQNIEIADTSNNKCNPSLDNLLTKETPNSEKKRKRIARVVFIVAALFVGFSCVLLGISLSMSDNINEMVRNSNELLRKHSKTTPIPRPETNVMKYDNISAT